MVNKPFWHICDFVLASHTFGGVKMSDFVQNNRNLREVLIFFFHSKKTGDEAHRELQKVYGDAALSETTWRDWFFRCKEGDFDVDDLPREGRPETFEDADVIYYKLLKPNETITGERYRMKLLRFSRALREKRPQYEQSHKKVILQCMGVRALDISPSFSLFFFILLLYCNNIVASLLLFILFSILFFLCSS